MSSVKLMWWIASPVLMSVLLLVAIMAASRGIANFYYFPAEKNLLSWDQSSGRDDRKVQHTDQLLQVAMQWDVSNPDILEAHGRFLDRSVEDQYFWQTGAEQAYRQALRDFRQTAVQRPSSPWVWINIALMKTKLQQYDALMQQALVQSTRLGPWEPLINVRVADIVLASWERLSEPTRRVASVAVGRGLQQDRLAMLQVIQRHRHTERLCQYWSHDQRLKELCSSIKG